MLLATAPVGPEPPCRLVRKLEPSRSKNAISALRITSDSVFFVGPKTYDFAVNVY